MRARDEKGRFIKTPKPEEWREGGLLSGYELRKLRKKERAKRL